MALLLSQALQHSRQDWVRFSPGIAGCLCRTFASAVGRAPSAPVHTPNGASDGEASADSRKHAAASPSGCSRERGLHPSHIARQAEQAEQVPSVAALSADAPPSVVFRQVVGGRVHETSLVVRADGELESRTRATGYRTLDGTCMGPAGSLLSELSRQLKATFLPAGYPDSVAPNYLPYVGWRALCLTTGAANGVLASSFLLYAVGLGQGAIPVAGAVNWVLKDGLGQAGTLLMARFMAQTFDDNARGWYIRGTLLMNIAIGIEIATSFTPEFFLFMGAAANSLKGLAWLTLGATCSAFNMAFQKKSNIADIYARSTTQSITVSLVGTAAGASLAAYVGQSPLEALAWSSLLCGINLFAAYRSTKAVPLRTLNPMRSRILAGHFLDAVMDKQKSHDPDKPMLPTPDMLAPRDPVVFWPTRLNKSFLHTLYAEGYKLQPPRIGTPIHKARNLTPRMLRTILEVYTDKDYIVFPMDGEMHIVLRDSGRDRCSIEAMLLAEIVTRRWLPRWQSELDPNPFEVSELRVLLDDSLHHAVALCDSFHQELQRAGWCTSRLILEGSVNQARW